VEIFDCGSGGRWFESTQLYQHNSHKPQGLNYAAAIRPLPAANYVATNWQPRSANVAAHPLNLSPTRISNDSHSDNQSLNSGADRKRISLLVSWGGVTINL